MMMLLKVFIAKCNEFAELTKALCWAAVTIPVHAKGFEHCMAVTKISWIAAMKFRT